MGKSEEQGDILIITVKILSHFVTAPLRKEDNDDVLYLS